MLSLLTSDIGYYFSARIRLFSYVVFLRKTPNHNFSLKAKQSTCCSDKVQTQTCTPNQKRPTLV